jgi:alpha-L-fucosidase 2
MNQQVMLYLPVPSNRGALLARPALNMFPSYLNNTWYSTYGSNPIDGGVNELWWLAQMQRYALAHGDDAMQQTSLLPGLRSVLLQSGLRNGTDNLLHVEGCLSPEYPMPRSTDCSYHLAIFRWAAMTAQALAEAFAPTDSALPVYRDIAARIAPFPIDNSTGSYELAVGVPFRVPHRHYSHLLAIYDLNLPTSNEVMAAGL